MELLLARAKVAAELASHEPNTDLAQHPWEGEVEGGPLSAQAFRRGLELYLPGCEEVELPSELRFSSEVPAPGWRIQRLSLEGKR